jgi:signal transduction histidine kinase
MIEKIVINIKEKIVKYLEKWTIKKIVIVFSLIIIASSFILFFYFQHQSESRIRNTIFEQQKKDQIDITKAIAEIIKSNLLYIRANLQGIVHSKYLQEGDFQSNFTYNLLKKRFDEINENTPIDRLFIVDKNGIAKINIVSKNQVSHVGENFSNREMARLSKNSLSPVFSNGYRGKDGTWKIGVSYPIISDNSKKYIGLVGVVISVNNFFDHFGNIYNMNSQYLAVLDHNAIHLVHPNRHFIGLSFFGNVTQQWFNHNTTINNYIKKVMEGHNSSLIYKISKGERLNTGYPIVVNKNKKPSYSLFVITPTSSIYLKINDVIYIERLEMFSLILGFASAIMILITLLIRWNIILDKEVKRRTKELETSNEQISMTNTKLEKANEQLKVHDKMQKEFINIAAHELRTPIMPILGLSEIVKNKLDEKEEKELLDIIIKNTKRLKNLTEDILDITRFESGNLHLYKEVFDIDKLIINIIREFEGELDSNKKIKFKYINSINDSVLIYADKNRIAQVISNLFNNSIKFISKEGDICISLEKKKLIINDDTDFVYIKIIDNGSGIDEEILPHLFKKFTTKSFQGTGLGLYICKNIVEAHGGKIFAENNNYNIGATFSFYIPFRN